MSQQLEPIFLTYATPHKRKGHNFNAGPPLSPSEPPWPITRLPLRLY